MNTQDSDMRFVYEDFFALLFRTASHPNLLKAMQKQNDILQEVKQMSNLVKSIGFIKFINEDVKKLIEH